MGLKQLLEEEREELCFTKFLIAEVSSRVY